MRDKPKTYFYELWMDLSTPAGLVCISKDIKEFNEYRFYEGKKVTDWPKDITFVVEGELLEDYIVGGLHWVIISESVRLVMHQLDPEGFQALPVTVLKDGGKIGPYWALNVIREVDALDIKHTIWVDDVKREKDEYPFLNIGKEAVLCDELQGVDIFRLLFRGFSGAKVFISERLRDSLIYHGAAKGFKFPPIPAY